MQNRPEKRGLYIAGKSKACMYMYTYTHIDCSSGDIRATTYIPTYLLYENVLFGSPVLGHNWVYKALGYRVTATDP